MYSSFNLIFISFLNDLYLSRIRKQKHYIYVPVSISVEAHRIFIDFFSVATFKFLFFELYLNKYDLLKNWESLLTQMHFDHSIS